MLRRRLVGALLVVATAVGGNTLSPRHARAQEVIDLDEDEAMDLVNTEIRAMYEERREARAREEEQQ